MRRWLAMVVVSVIVLPVAMLAQKPVHNVSKAKHPNLAQAQHLVDQAFNKISAAQAANEWDMNGHAAKAKELLDQANKELKLAAETANRNKK